MPAPIPDSTRQRILELATAGESCGAIARELGVARSTVSVIARAMGHTFDRSATKQATEIRVADVRASMADLARKLVATAHRLHDELYAPSLVYAFGGRDNDYSEHVLEQPDARTKRELLTSIGIAVDKVRVIEGDADAGGAGRAAIIRLVDQLADAVETA